MAKKLYDLVKEQLEKHKEYRNSDKKLIWGIWMELDYVRAGMVLNYVDFMDAPTPESITRARRKVQENHPELAGSIEVKKARELKREQKGTHIYREEVEPNTDNAGQIQMLDLSNNGW